MFSAARTRDVEWRGREIFNSLVLEEDQKEFIHDLVQEPRRNDGLRFDDVVRDKGKGLVGLLAGPPGVGKVC